jgi:hypothetical protein
VYQYPFYDVFLYGIGFTFILISEHLSYCVQQGTKDPGYAQWWKDAKGREDGRRAQCLAISEFRGPGYGGGYAEHANPKMYWPSYSDAKEYDPK